MVGVFELMVALPATTVAAARRLGTLRYRSRERELRAQLQEALREVDRHRRAGLAIADAVHAVLTGGEGPEAIIQAARSITDALMVALLQPDSHGDLVCTGSTPDSALGMRLPLNGTSVSARCFNTGRPVWTDDAEDGSVALPLRDQFEVLAGGRLASLVWFPIMASGRCLGVLWIGCPLGVDPPSRHQALLELLAGEIAMALTHGELVRELERLSTLDPLTGVANRRAWEQGLGGRLRRSRRDHEPLSILLIDLDHFKLFNDSYGHSAGDDLLREVCRIWSARLRPGDLLCRWGGEEFAVLLPRCGLDGARGVAEELRRLMPVTATCSIGVVEWDGEETPESLLHRVDTHLYAAKAGGRDRVSS